MPFLGKQTVPAKLRKDMWTPLATVSFPSGPQGLAAYQQLREFSKRHLHEWTIKELEESRAIQGMRGLVRRTDGLPPGSNFLHKKEKRRFLRKQVGPALQDQKANSVADLAAVMYAQERAARMASQKTLAESEHNRVALAKANARLTELLQMRRDLRSKTDEESVRKYRQVKLEKIKLQKAMQAPMPYKALAGKYHMMNDNRLPARRGPLRRLGLRHIPRPSMNGVKIEWANLLDAQFAKSWPEAVVHSELALGGGRSRHVATTAIAAREGTKDPQYGEEKVSVASSMPIIPQATAPSTTLSRLISRLRDGSR